MRMADDSRTGRGASRFRAGLTAVLLVDGEELACSAFDLSRSGVLLVGELPEVDRRRVRVRLESAAGDLRLTSDAEVVRCGEPEPDGRRVGVVFHDLGEEQTRELDALVSRVVEGMAPAPLEALKSGATTDEIRTTLGRIPLAHRITLAGRAELRDRKILIQDPSPQVLEALARNPNLTTPELRSLVRLQQLRPSTLELLAADPRVSGAEELRLLVATHPKTPLSAAEKLVAMMNARTVERLIQMPGLHPVLRTKLGAKRRRG